MQRPTAPYFQRSKTRKEQWSNSDSGGSPERRARFLPGRLLGCPHTRHSRGSVLASGSARLVLEQHVRHSSNHLSKPQARHNATSTRQGFVPGNFRPEKALWNFHSRKGHIFPPTSARPSLISLAPATMHIPCSLVMLRNSSPCPTAQWN